MSPKPSQSVRKTVQEELSEIDAKKERVKRRKWRRKNFSTHQPSTIGGLSIQTLSDLSRADQNNLTIEQAEVDDAGLLQEVVDKVSAQAIVADALSATSYNDERGTPKDYRESSDRENYGQPGTLSVFDE